RHLQVAAATAPVVAGGAAAALAGAPAGWAVAAGAALLGAAVDALALRRARAWAYAQRADDLVVHRGLMFRRTSVVPYGRMQIVDVTAGPFERAFGLASVRLHTAAATSDARIPGLDATEAARLRDQLSALGEHQATGL
ncbi:MAG TPA: PH domain-containing protein, partial [Acidimicrobiales bacterium]|nr:PH domain-containing protein [Acidimicrobiales bacterium]